MEFYNERKYNKPTQFEYELLKPDGYVKVQDFPAKYEPIYYSFGYIDYLTDNISFRISTFDELTLTIPKYVQDPSNKFQRRVCPAWENIKGDYIIEISNNVSEEKERFLVVNVETQADEKEIKKVTAYSLEYEYAQKALRNFTSKGLDENDLDIDKPKYLREILEHLNNKYMENTWSIGTIDSNVALKQRTYDYSDGTIHNFFKQLQESFNCLLKFDTIKRTVSAYDLTVYPVCPKCHKSEYLVFMGSQLECFNPDCYIDVSDENENMFDAEGTMVITDKDGKERTVLARTDKNGKQEKANWIAYLYGRDTGLYLHEANYVQKFNESTDNKEIVTRLYVYGKDDLGINTASENYTGQAYIDNLSYFRKPEYMSADLLNALDAYDRLYETSKGEWIELNDKSYDLKREYSKATVISSDSKNLLDNLQCEIKAVQAMTKLQANGYSTDTLNDLKEQLKDYWDIVTKELDSKGEPKTIGDILEEICEIIEETEGNIVDLSNAIKRIVDDVEGQFDELTSSFDGDVDTDDLSDYSLEQLEEALSVYESRVKVLLDISNNIISPDVDSELTTGEVWESGDKVYYRVIQENEDNNTATVVLPAEGKTGSNIENDMFFAILPKKSENEFFEITLPAEYNGKMRDNSSYALQVWLSKRNEGKSETYADRVLQTENVQYYVLKTSETSNQYKIRQNSIDLTKIKSRLEKAIEVKKAEVERIEAEQRSNQEQIDKFKDKISKEKAVDENGNLIFSTELLLEMNRYIKEQVYTNTAIGVADINEDIGTDLYRQRVNDLYQDGLTILDTKHTPKVEFDIGIVNFMRDVRYQRDWNKISLGDMIHIGHMDASNDDYVVRIIQFDWSNDDTRLNLTLSNEDKLKTNNAIVKNLIESAKSTSATLNVKKEKWNNAETNAVETIITNGWDAAVSAVTSGDETDVVIDKRGITLKNPLKPEYQIRQTHNVITFTDDNWNTTRTAISNGHIIADVIVGRLLVGQSLQITATKADGTTLTFKVNGEGVFISNGSLVIEPLNTEDESNGVEIHPGKGKGLIITHKDNKFRVVLNADRGLVFQRQEIGSGDWTKVNEPVFIDTKGNAVFGGDIHARRLYLQEIGGENILTYIDQKYDPIKKKYTYTNSFDDNTNIDNKGETEEVPQYKISGNYLEGRGLKAYDKNNNLRVHINGADGSLKMYNGYIEMQNVVTDSNGRVLKDSNGKDLYNELHIDPDEFIKWTIKNEDKFYYDPDIVVTKKGNKTETGALVFRGLLKTDSLSVISGDDGEAWLRIDSSGISGDRVKFDAGSRPLEIRCGSLWVGTGNNAAQTVATAADISKLDSEIQTLKDKIAALSSPAPPIG